MNRAIPFALALLLACSPSKDPPTPQPPVPPDTDLCGAVCAHLANLHCEEGSPVYDSDEPGPRGVPNLSCQAFCEKTQKRGVYVNPTCILKVTSVTKGCPEVEQARQKTCPRESK